MAETMYEKQIEQQQADRQEIRTIGLIINSYKEQIVQIGREVIAHLKAQAYMYWRWEMKPTHCRSQP